MTDKELKRLRRTELLELFLAQSKQVESLENKVAQLEKELHDRRIVMEETGSIAEAALKLNKVFEQAQQAADDYVQSVKLKIEEGIDIDAKE